MDGREGTAPSLAGADTTDGDVEIVEDVHDAYNADAGERRLAAIRNTIGGLRVVDIHGRDAAYDAGASRFASQYIVRGVLGLLSVGAASSLRAALHDRFGIVMTMMLTMSISAQTEDNLLNVQQKFQLYMFCIMARFRPDGSSGDDEEWHSSLYA